MKVRYPTALCVCQAAAFVLSALATARKPSPSPNESSQADRDQILRVQLFLDQSDFKPGVIDGHWGEFTRKALIEYEKAQGKPAPQIGEQMPAELDLPLDQTKPTLTTYDFTANDQQSLGTVPEKHAEQTKLERLPYRDLLELVAEKFHVKREFLQALNPGFDWSQAKEGDHVQVPNVAAPFDLQEALDLKNKTEETEKAKRVQKESDKSDAEQLEIEVDVSQRILELHQGGKLVGSYPITPGSKSLPAPKGEWFVRGIVWLPTFRWDEAMLKHDRRSSDAYHLPPGPNNPVGILWMELSHKGSGIHGTDEPETIGRTTSHGCIRLSNWDALDLGKKVRPGVRVRIR